MAAAMVGTDPTTPGSSAAKEEQPRLSVPSRNPLPLSASQEAQVRDIYYARVRRHCDKEIRAFAECSSTRTFSVTWACRKQNLAMNNCMIAHATQAEQDRAREEWFAKRLERQRERERHERRALEQKEFLREWWKLPLDERDEQKMREMEEKWRRKERVGGLSRPRAEEEKKS